MKKEIRSSLKHVPKESFLRSPKTIVAFILLIISPLLTVAIVQQRQDIRQRAQAVPTPPPVAINIADFQYNPGTITVPAGTRITWTNRSTQNVRILQHLIIKVVLSLGIHKYCRPEAHLAEHLTLPVRIPIIVTFTGSQCPVLLL